MTERAVTNHPSGAGIGDLVTCALSARVAATVEGLPYKHTPFLRVAHKPQGTPQESWDSRWNAMFPVPDMEGTGKRQAIPPIPSDLLDNAWESQRQLVRSFFSLVPVRRCALHVRLNDVTKDGPFSTRFTPFPEILRVALLLPPPILVFTDQPGHPDITCLLSAVDSSLDQSPDARTAFIEIASSRIIVAAKSDFSSLAAIASPFAQVFAPSFFRHRFRDWKPLP
jgi:hypothetical protein